MDRTFIFVSARAWVATWLAALLGIVIFFAPTLTGGSHAHSLTVAGRHPQIHPLRQSADSTVLAYPAPPIQASAAYLMDLGSGRVLYTHNADAKRAIASTTKITTAALVLAHSRLGDLVRVSEKAATIGESTMVLQHGERLTVRDLLYGLLLNSGNDAAIALAEHVDGSVRGFVTMMNTFARQLGMRHTHYATPHGLDAPHQYSSARDLAIVARYAMRDATFRQIVGSSNYHIPATRHNKEHWLANINRFMFWFPGVDGVKPGQTDQAGLCQVVSVWRGGRHLLAVLLNTPNLWVDMRNLVLYGSHDFRWVQAPVWSDSPANALVGGSGSRSWRYYVAAGHYVRGPFLRYFADHGGAPVLGYPRTEAISLHGRIVQFFQDAELVWDPVHHSVYPEALGEATANALVRAAVRPGAQITPGFAGAYRQFGGRAVLGAAITPTVQLSGHTIQFFQYGAIAQVGGAPSLLPAGDVVLRSLGWLPAAAISDAYPPTLAPGLVALGAHARGFGG